MAAALVGLLWASRPARAEKQVLPYGGVGDQAATHSGFTSHSNSHMFGEAAGPEGASGFLLLQREHQDLGQSRRDAGLGTTQRRPFK